MKKQKEDHHFVSKDVANHFKDIWLYSNTTCFLCGELKKHYNHKAGGICRLSDLEVTKNLTMEL